MTLEAAALHFLEFADAQLRRFATVLKEKREPDSAWTAYERSLGRRLFVGYPAAAPVEEMPTEEVPPAQIPSVAEPLPSLEEVPPIPSELELLPSELEALTTDLPELPSELPELPELPETQPLTEIEEEVPRKRKPKRAEPPEEGRLPL
jgi:3'-5' exoribonuclease